MAFNPFKKKEEKTPEAVTVSKAVVKQAATPLRAAGKFAVEPGILLSPHITEKASALGERGQYVFRVRQSATKGGVKAAVKALYGVDVENVRMTRKPSKNVRLGRKQGRKPGFKKAAVQVRKGQTIDLISR